MKAVGLVVTFMATALAALIALWALGWRDWTTGLGAVAIAAIIGASMLIVIDDHEERLSAPPPRSQA